MKKEKHTMEELFRQSGQPKASIGRRAAADVVSCGGGGGEGRRRMCFRVRSSNAIHSVPLQRADRRSYAKRFDNTQQAALCFYCYCDMSKAS